MSFIMTEIKGLSGLSNLGNTCYINGVLQCLVHLRPFTYRLLYSKNTRDSFVMNYMTLLRELFKKNHAIAPVTLKRAINNSFNGKYDNVDQHDSQEFLLDFLEKMHVGTINKTVSIETKYSSKQYRTAMKTWREYFNRKTSVISKLFYGQYYKQINCAKCKKCDMTFDPFVTLNLKPNKSINEMLVSHFRGEKVTYKCDGCSENTVHKIKNCIYKLPDILIISINRFNTNLSKNTNKITIETILDLSNFIYSNDDESVVYELESMVCHIGSIRSGHYYALVKIGEAWMCFNDTRVSQVDMKTLDLSTPYILFYTRKI